MVKKLSALMLAILLVLTTVPALANEEVAPVTSEELLNLVKPHVNIEEDISRGAFSQMLVHSAKISSNGEDIKLPSDLKDTWYKEAVIALVKKGIMQGAPDGKIYAEAPIKLGHAKILVARTLDISSSEGLDLQLKSWLDKLFIGDDLQNLKAKDAAKLLSDIFGKDEKAQELILKSDEATNKAKSFRMNGDISVKMDIVPAMPDVPAEVDMHFSSEFSSDKIVKQIIKGEIPILDIPLEIEQYMDKDYIYMSIPSEEEEVQWLKMKNPASFVFDEDFIEAQKKEMLKLDAKLPYHIIGEEKFEDKDCYILAIYQRMENPDEILKAFDNIPGLDDSNKALFTEAMQMFDSLLLRGIVYIGKDDNLVHNAQIDYSVALNAKGQEESPFQLKSMNIKMDCKYLDYGKDIKIDIPSKALEAEELDLNLMMEENQD